MAYYLAFYRRGEVEPKAAVWWKCESLVDYEHEFVAFFKQFGEYGEAYGSACNGRRTLQYKGWAMNVVEETYDSPRDAATRLWNGLRPEPPPAQETAQNWMFRDPDDNMLYCINGELELVLAGGAEKKRIGKIDGDGNYRKGVGRPLSSITEKFNKAFDGWGICCAVVTKLADDAKIIFFTDVGRISITKTELINKKFRTVHLAGYERQFVVPDAYWTKDGGEARGEVVVHKDAGASE